MNGQWIFDYGDDEGETLTPSEIAKLRKRRPHESPTCRCRGCASYDIAQAAQRPETD